MCDEYGGADDFESDEEPLDEVPEEDLDTKPGKSHKLCHNATQGYHVFSSLKLPIC